MARDIALYHHERWDGTGYPKALIGNEIPIAARIVALADVYDALTSRRVYRDAMTHNQAKHLILKEREFHFDPDVVDAFLAVEPNFIAVRERFRDDEVEASGPEILPASRIEAPDQKTQQKVLVVDDDPIVRDLLLNFLDSRGIECISSANGREALAAVEQHRPRIIISDWEMPEMDGLELCRRVRSRIGAEHVHFIMLTVHAASDELSKAFDAGVDDFIAKPFNDMELMGRLRTGFRAVGLYDALARQHQGSQQLNEQLTQFNRRLEKLATTDDLTGLYNRRHATHRIEEHWALAERYHRPMAVVSIDIDHFKAINDEYGHPAGDAVLRGVAGILRLCVRSTDMVCRVGGRSSWSFFRIKLNRKRRSPPSAADWRWPSSNSNSRGI